MDQVKIGKFIASLRKQAELTQEELGEKLGVTNKTISRWENGNYMPDIEMLQLLAKEFHVNINEILAGERMSDAEFRKKADENIIAVSKSSAFSFEETESEQSMTILTKTGVKIVVYSPSVDLESRLHLAFSVYYNEINDATKEGSVIYVPQKGNITTSFDK